MGDFTFRKLAQEKPVDEEEAKAPEASDLDVEKPAKKKETQGVKKSQKPKTHTPTAYEAAKKKFLAKPLGWAPQVHLSRLEQGT